MGILVEVSVDQHCLSTFSTIASTSGREISKSTVVSPMLIILPILQRTGKYHMSRNFTAHTFRTHSDGTIRAIISFHAVSNTEQEFRVWLAESHRSNDIVRHIRQGQCGRNVVQIGY